MRASFRRIPLLAAATAMVLWLAGCAGAQVTRGEGQTIAQARAEKYDGPKYRIAVGNIIDKTDPLKDQSVGRQVAAINAKRPPDQQIEASGITAGIRDLLVTELFNSGQFIVLEREALRPVLVEQEFAQSARVGDTTRIPLGELEGAELLVVGAVTAFDAGLSGVAIPIPIPLGKDFSNGVGLLSLGYKRGFAAMDIRIVDAATGRIVASTAVEGRNSNYGLELKGVYTGSTGYVPLPGLLNVFSKTPVEAALQKMVIAAIGKIAEQKPSKILTTPLPAATGAPATVHAPAAAASTAVPAATSPAKPVSIPASAPAPVPTHPAPVASPASAPAKPKPASP